MKNKILLNDYDAAYFSTHFLEKGQLHPLSKSFEHWKNEEKQKYVNYLCGGERTIEENRNLLQMLLLHDEIVFPYGVLDNVDISAIKNYFNVTILNADDFYDEYKIIPSCEETFARKEDKNFVEYIKPSIINYLVQAIGKKYYPITGKLSCEEFMSQMIDYAFGEKMEIEFVFSGEFYKNVAAYTAREFNPIYVDNPKNPIEETMTYLSELFFEIQYVFYKVLWEVKQSNDNDCLIYNSNYDIQNLGLMKDQYSASCEQEIYSNIRINISDKIHQLPEMMTFEELLRIKENSKHDIKRLREVITELERAVFDQNINVTRKVITDLEKAVKELNWSKKLSSVSTIATYSAVPIGVAETIANVFPATGITVGIIGSATTFAANYFSKQNNWINIVR